MTTSGEKDPILSVASDEEVEDTKANIERLAIKLAERMAEKMTNERAEKMAEEIAKDKVKKMMEEREKALEDKILQRLMKKMNIDQDNQPPPPSPKKPSSSTKQEYHQLPFDYSRNSIPCTSTNVSSSSLGKVPILEGSNYDEWANKMKLVWCPPKSLGDCECRYYTTQRR
jgi:hypothetical protein